MYESEDRGAGSAAPNSRARTAGTAIPVRDNDIDTDRIIPARFMKCVTFEGLGKYAFYDERFDAKGQSKGHTFDDPKFAGGAILLVNKNFGCGSSREHAPQALAKYGIRGIVGESFAEIFAGNCTALGIPAVQVSEADVTALMEIVELDPSTEVTIDLESSRVCAGNLEVSASLPASYRTALLGGGWDSTSSLLENAEMVQERYVELPYVKGF